MFMRPKVIIYLTNVSETSGPFAYEDPLRKIKLGVVGEAGTTVLFESSKSYIQLLT